MFFIVAALLMLGVLLGTVAHVPVPVSLVAAIAIAAWLAIFTIRERQHR
ncbi:hypothetical protein QWM81_18445 [Streptomyces ficellus]|uniref:Small hydrophobic membrane protein n=1 Tax=Streptomyces ficellus TaxID=1977088 RepID=A0ABT7Z912_9ACTN|nr:hypothetical protein [Streptomyces ficellus]MDN3295998.1 hypothetical protein [Streptomyces ficellus]